MNWRKLLKTINGGGDTSPSSTFLGVYILGKLFFIRRNQEEMLDEHKKILTQLLEHQQRQPQVIVQNISPPVQPNQNSSSEKTEEQIFTIEDTVTFIPRIAKAKTDLSSGVETSAAKFDPDGVEKLRKAKLKALKK
jgi:hypothetical protein